MSTGGSSGEEAMRKADATTTQARENAGSRSALEFYEVPLHRL